MATMAGIVRAESQIRDHSSLEEGDMNLPIDMMDWIKDYSQNGIHLSVHRLIDRLLAKG